MCEGGIEQLCVSAYQNFAAADKFSLLLLGFSSLDLGGGEEGRRSLLSCDFLQLVKLGDGVWAEDGFINVAEQSFVLTHSLAELQVGNGVAGEEAAHVIDDAQGLFF